MLSRALGETVWKSISFFDMKTLSKDPDKLPNVLGNLFGTHAGVLEKVIAEDVLTKLGVAEEARKSYDFRSFIRVAKARFLSSSAGLTAATS